MSGEEKVKDVVVEKQVNRPTAAEIKAYKKQQAAEYVNYKKRLREAVELKKLQNEELELNIRIYHNTVKWRELKPKVQELEALEEAELKAQQEELSKTPEK